MLFPILEVFEAQYFVDEYVTGKQEGKFLIVYAVICPNVTLCLQALSGVLMIHGVIKIKQNFTEYKTCAMVIHAAAFGFFLLSVLLLGIASLIFTFNSTLKTQYIYAWASIIYIYMSFISQVLLCMIFWKIGGKKEEQVEVEDTETGQDEEQPIVEIKVENYDEKDEIQARIWQYFVREAKGLNSPRLSHDSKPLLLQSTMVQSFEEDE